MKHLYSLRIDCENPDEVDRVLGTSYASSNGSSWIWELEQAESDPPTPFVDRFLALLNNKYTALQDAGVMRNDISVWVLYEYQQQCNLEFAALDLKRLGDEGLALCVSCWEK